MIVNVIYQILNVQNQNKYIGSTVKFEKRKYEHIKRLKANKHHSQYLQNAWNKYGEEFFQFSILEHVEITKKLIEREQFWIDALKPEYNICKIANSSLGVKRSQETIERIRKANLGLKHPEWRNKLKTVYQTGKTHSSYSTEIRKKLSDIHKKRYQDGYTHPNIKAIVQLNKDLSFVKEWISIAEAERFYKTRSITSCLIKKSKTAVGFLWKYKEEFENGSI